MKALPTEGVVSECQSQVNVGSSVGTRVCVYRPANSSQMSWSMQQGGGDFAERGSPAPVLDATLPCVSSGFAPSSERRSRHRASKSLRSS